jgi:hypothetical protein
MAGIVADYQQQPDWKQQALTIDLETHGENSAQVAIMRNDLVFLFWYLVRGAHPSVPLSHSCIVLFHHQNPTLSHCCNFDLLTL